MKTSGLPRLMRPLEIAGTLLIEKPCTLRAFPRMCVPQVGDNSDDG